MTKKIDYVEGVNYEKAGLHTIGKDSHKKSRPGVEVGLHTKLSCGDQNTGIERG